MSLTPLRIRLPYTTEQEFIEKYGSNVGRGGMFVATRSLKDEGTGLAFELVLADGSRLMRGEGVVQKTQIDHGGSRAGMTVRFVRLDANGRTLVERIVSARSHALSSQPASSAPAPESEVPEPGRRSPSLGPGDDEVTPVSAVDFGSKTLPASESTSGSATGPEPELTFNRTPMTELGSEQRARRRNSLLELSVQTPTAPQTNEPSPVLGIDWGTTQCRVALFGAPNHPQDTSTLELPGTLYLDEEGRWTGTERPKLSRASVKGLKRLLGKNAPAGDGFVEARGEQYSVRELASLWLKDIRAGAAVQWGVDTRRVVLCVPNDFHAEQRAALTQVATDAGLEVLRLVSSAAAAAVAYAHGRGFARRRLMVFDLGAGGFEALVVEMTGEDAEVVASIGDPQGGSLHLTRALEEKLTAQLQSIHPTLLENLREGVLEEAVQRALRSLAVEERTQVELELGAVLHDGAAGSFETPLERSEVEALGADVMKRAVALTLEMLKAAGLEPSAINEVLLMGGATALPWVQQKLAEIFRAPIIRVSADAAARGAALFGETLRRAELGKSHFALSEVLDGAVGLGLADGNIAPVLERFTRLPAQKSFSFPVQENEEPVIALFQGNGTRTEDRAFIGFAKLEKMTRSGEVNGRLDVSESGTLQLWVRLPGMTETSKTLQTEPLSLEGVQALLASAPKIPTSLSSTKRSGLFQGLKRLLHRPPSK